MTDILAQLSPAIAGLLLVGGLWAYIRHLKAVVDHDREIHPAE